MRSIILIDKAKACELLVGIGRDILDADVDFDKKEEAIEKFASLAFDIGGPSMADKVAKGVWPDNTSRTEDRDG